MNMKLFHVYRIFKKNGGGGGCREGGSSNPPKSPMDPPLHTHAKLIYCETYAHLMDSENYLYLGK